MSNTQKPQLPASTFVRVIQLVRITGGLMMVGAACLAFNVGGFADLLGLNDGTMNYMIGGLLGMVGLMDMIVVPRLLESKANPKI